MDTAALIVIDYEIMMFLGVPLLQSRVKINTENKFMPTLVQNILVETRVLHIRVLTEVFLSEGKPDDIKANLLIPEWCNQNSDILKELRNAYKTELPESGASPKTLIDKHLAHATFQRGASFDWSPVTNRMEQPLINALKALPVGQFPSLKLLNEVMR